MLQPKDLLHFTVFEETQESKLQTICDTALVQEFEVSEVVFQQNDPAYYLYGLLQGQIDLQFLFLDKVLETHVEYEEAVTRNMRNVPRQLVLETLDKGQLFGWSSMVGNEHYTATAICTKPAKVFRIEVGAFRAILNADSEMGYEFMNHLARIIARRLELRTEKLLESWVQAFGEDRMD